MGVKVEGVSNGVEIHELNCQKVLGQDTRLQTIKI